MSDGHENPVLDRAGHAQGRSASEVAADGVAVLALDRARADRIARLLPWSTQLLQQVDQLRQALHCGAWACVVVADWLDARACTWLHRIRLEHPSLGVVLVTDDHADNARELKRVIVDEVVWIRDSRTQLIAALERVRRPSLAQRLGTLLLHAEHRTDPYVISHVAKVLHRVPPVPSVAELARECALSYSQLTRRFGAMGCTPGHFLSAVRVLAGLDLAMRGMKAERIAGALGMDKRSLERCANRLFNRTFTELRRSPDVALFCTRGMLRSPNGATAREQRTATLKRDVQGCSDHGRNALSEPWTGFQSRVIE